MKSINIVGCGRVGRTLASLWHDSGNFRIGDVLTTSAQSAQEAVQFIGAGSAVTQIGDMRPADIWMLAVPDREIAPTATALAQAQGAHQQAVAFHCSGALTSSELLALRDLGWTVASAHCLLSFASSEAALQQFAGTPCALEGEARALAALTPALEGIGATCFAMASENKLLYHAGAVFASNFAPVLQSLANQLWTETGVPPEVSRRLQASLLSNVVQNIVNLGPAAALTGPAARGDLALVENQHQAVSQWNKAAGQAYEALSKLATALAASTPRRHR